VSPCDLLSVLHTRTDLRAPLFSWQMNHFPPHLSLLTESAAVLNFSPLFFSSMFQTASATLGSQASPSLFICPKLLQPPALMLLLGSSPFPYVCNTSSSSFGFPLLSSVMAWQIPDASASSMIQLGFFWGLGLGWRNLLIYLLRLRMRSGCPFFFLLSESLSALGFHFRQSIALLCFAHCFF